MYNRRNLEVYKFAAKGSLKPELRCVAFFGNKTVATDSFRVVEISASGEAHDPILVDEKYVKRLKLGVNQTVGIESFPEGRVEAKFPDYESVIAKEDGREEVIVHVNGVLLGEVLLELAKLDKHATVTLCISTEAGRPISITVDGPQKARALVMPRIGKR